MLRSTSRRSSAVWALEEAELARLPKPKALASDRARRRVGHGRAIAHRLAAEGACVVVADRDTAAAEDVAPNWATPCRGRRSSM